MRTGPGSRPGALALAVTLAVALLAPAAVAQQAAPTDLLISEYVEGSSNNKALEFYNGTGEDIDLAGYVVQFSFNGSTNVGATIALEGTIASDDVFVLADNDFVNAGDADQVSTATFYNGDDLIVLRDPAGEIVDSFGQSGIDPGTQWGSGDTGAQDNTLRRLPSVCAGDTNLDDAFDPAAEYAGFGVDAFDGLGEHTSDCGGSGTNGPADLLISEYVEGSSTNKAVEIWNGTDGDVDLAGYILEVYFNANTTPSLAQALSGTLASGDVFVFAATALEQYADQTTGAGLWNGNDTIVVRNTAGEVVDSFGKIAIGSDFAANTTLRRLTANCTADNDPTDAVDLSGYEPYPSDTFDGLGSHQSTCGNGGGGTGGDAVVINEFSASTAGTDVEYVEVFGTPDTDYSDLTILQVEGDSSSSNFGQVIGSDAVGTTDGAGFWTVYPPSTSLQNGTLALLLVRDWNGSTDATGDLGAAVDAIGVNDGGADDSTFGAPALVEGYDGLNFTPGGASRIPDGTDTDTVDDWVRNDFDLAGIDGQTGTPVVGEAFNTPGAPNRAVEDDGGGGGGACGDPAVAIGTVQGAGASTPIPGQTVEIEGVVVGDFQNGDGTAGELGGFHVQDAGDGDAATSDGVFVFGDDTTEVNVGDIVHVTGGVREFTVASSAQTQVDAASVVVCGPGTLPDPVAVTLPMTDEQWEAFEGMYVTLPQDLAILEYFNYDRFGELVLGTDRQFQPTAVYEPGSADALALSAANELNRVTLDDGLSTQNPEVTRHPNGDPFSLDNRFRGGDLVTNATGVLDDTFGLYRIQPTAGADFTVANPRPDVPEVGGTMTVASFNVLNYFTTLGSRGADTEAELVRQEDKIVAALAAMDADVVGLIEIENNTEAIVRLVAALNAVVGADTYDFVDTGTIGTDEIKVAFIYKPATVTPDGDYALLDGSVDERFLDSKNRPALAQTFVEDATGASVTVAVNHLKSKGSSCNDVGDPEDPDGQGNCNGVRADAAAALVDWMAADPTGTGADNALIIGDLNAYDHEDPIDVLVDGGWTDLLLRYGGEYAYSYVFDGQLGYLDYALANPAVLDDVTGAAAWHVNADEPDLIDYDTSFKSDGQDAIYAPDPWRASDHDPVLIGLAMSVVDTTAPAAPVIITPADGSITADNTPDVTGTGEPGATVAVTIDGADVGSTTVDADGTWTLVTTVELGDGPHTVTATQTDAAGNTSDPDSNTFTVDTTAPDAPVIISPADGSITLDDTPDVTGTGDPGATVDVTIDDTDVGSTTVDADGNWTLVTTDPLDDGTHTVTATQTDAAGNTSDPDSNTFTVDTTPPELTVTVTPDRVQQNNHKYVEVTATVIATDVIDDDVAVRLVSVTSNEPDNGLGDGDTAEDIVILSDTTFLLRAERSGRGTGRVYTITYEATDVAGNTTTATATVVVPK